MKADLFFNLGVIHTQLGDYLEAEKAFEEAIFLNDQDFDAIRGMVEAYQLNGDNFSNGLDGIEQDFDKAYIWYRKAERRLKELRTLDTNNIADYNRRLNIIRLGKIMLRVKCNKYFLFDLF